MLIKITRLLCFFLFFAVILLYFSGCTCSNNSSQKEEEPNSLTNFPEGSFFEIPNNSGTHLLLIENTNGKQNILIQKRVYVYDKANNEIILEDFVPNGKAFWKNDTQVQIEKYPGTISKKESDNRLGYVFDISTFDKSEIK